MVALAKCPSAPSASAGDKSPKGLSAKAQKELWLARGKADCNPVQREKLATLSEVGPHAQASVASTGVPSAPSLEISRSSKAEAEQPRSLNRSITSTVDRSFAELEVLAELPQGSFGAGGWAPSKGGGNYPRLTPDEAVSVRKEFHALLLKRFHSICRAWKWFDRDGNGRLSIFEFMRACQELGVQRSARQIWDALDMDRSGFVSLEEIDIDMAKMLGTLALTIWVSCGTLEAAWEQYFNKKGYTFRVPKDDFVQACQEIGCPGDGAEIFEALRSDLATVGISREEFGFLDLWFKEGHNPERGPLHDKVSEGLKPQRKQDAHDVNQAPSAKAARDAEGQSKKEFKKQLIVTYGSYLRAWREGLDRDHNGSMDKNEFRRACKDVGYAGTLKDLWAELDCDGNGSVSLKEIDQPTASMVENIYNIAVKRHGSWQEAWTAVFDPQGSDRVTLRPFIEASRILGYKGNPDRLFETLDTDRARYLTLQTTAWIAAAVTGTEEPEKKPDGEDLGDVTVSGLYKGMTCNQMRRMDTTDRDARLRQQRFTARARGEVPGSSPTAGTLHSGGNRRIADLLKTTGTREPPALSSSAATLARQSTQDPANDSSMRKTCPASWTAPAWPEQKRVAFGKSPAPVSRDLPSFQKQPLQSRLPAPSSKQADGGQLSPLAQTGSSLLGSGSPQASRALPVAPLPAAELDCATQRALARSVISEPALSRWRLNVEATRLGLM